MPVPEQMPLQHSTEAPHAPPVGMQPQVAPPVLPVDAGTGTGAPIFCPFDTQTFG